jgi:hypothetical protein
LTLDRGRLPRGLALRLGLRRVSPDPRLPAPGAGHVRRVSGLIESGGGFRPPFRAQDPAIDPREPQGGEGAAAGFDHGWQGCTMSAGGMAHGWHRQSSTATRTGTPWGGDVRHAQSDLVGGTDLYDLRRAWAKLDGAELRIRTGQGWPGLEDAWRDWRAAVIQGIGNVPGEGTYSGAHAIVLLPERHPTDPAARLIGDPLTSGYQWVPRAKIRAWAEAWDPELSFAVSAAHPPPAPPTPTPEPPPGPPAPPEPPVASWDLAAALWPSDGLVWPWAPGRWGGPAWSAIGWAW